MSGADAVEEFRALRFLLGRRPHQLVAELVDEGIGRIMSDPAQADTVAKLVALANGHRREREIRELNALLGFGDG